MKKTTTTRLVIFVTAFSAVGLLAAMQGCSSSGDTPATTDTDSGPSSSGNPDTGTSSGNPTDSGTDANKADANKADTGTDSGACFDNVRGVDGGADGGTFPCPGAGACDDICTAVYRSFKMDVADDIIKSLVPANDCVAADGNSQRATVIAKVKTSSAKSCVDTTVAAWCGAVPQAAGCRGDATFDANCAAIVKGLTGNGTFSDANTGGRQIAFECMNGLASPDLPDCNACLLGVASGILFTPN